MLLDLEDMPDEAQIWAFVASRMLTDEEQRELRTIADEWLATWHTTFSCPASKSRVTEAGRVLVWAVDDRPRVLRGVTDGLTGTELDPLFRNIEKFESEQKPSMVIRPSEALIVNDEIIPFGPGWTRLREKGLLTPQTLILRNCTISDWRAGRFIHPLGDDPMAKYLLNSEMG